MTNHPLETNLDLDSQELWVIRYFSPLEKKLISKTVQQGEIEDTLWMLDRGGYTSVETLRVLVEVERFPGTSLP